MEQFDSRLNAGLMLAVDLAPGGLSLTLNAVPGGLLAGTYRLRIQGEILTGEYSGGGGDTTFTNLARGQEGTDATIHYAGVTVRHVITGASLNALRDSAIAEAQSPQGPLGPEPLLYVPSVGDRLFLASNFS